MAKPSVYQGIRPFQGTNSSLFFGRESDIKRLIEVLDRHSLVLLVGESGAGKTSLIHAGVLPTLQRNPQTAFPLQFVIRPGSKPLFAFATALANNDATETRRIYESLKSNSDFATSLLAQRGCTSDKKALLIADQFDELYTAAEATEAATFVDAMLASYKSSLLALIISIRSDFVADVAKDERFLRYLSDSMVVLGPPSITDLRRAIVEPATAAGVTFEAGLVDRIIQDIQAFSDQRGNLPVLQLLLNSLWEHRHSDVITLSDYVEIGTVKGVVAAFLERNWRQFDEADQPRLRRIVPHLITPQGTRRLASIDEFDAGDRKLIDQLVNKRLMVMPSSREGQVFVELSHDYLVAPLSRVIDTLDTEQKRRSTALSRLAGTFGFNTLEQRLEQRSREFEQTQARYNTLMSQFSKLNEQKAQLEKQFEALQMDIQKDTPKVFLSYVREDEQVVRALYRDLKAEGIQPWLDKEDLMTGVEWDRAIRKSIRQSDFIVICISSRTAVKRGYIQRELRLALDCYEELPPGEAFLMPVRLEECEVPEDLLKYEYTDLFRDDGFNRLVKSIMSHWARRERQ